MKHATADSLRTIATLLEQLRALPGLREKKPGVFYRRSSPFLHFHEDPQGMFADLRDLHGGWSRARVQTQQEQADFVPRVIAASENTPQSSHPQP